MKYKDIFFKHSLGKGYFTVTIKNKNNKVVYNGLNLLSALSEMLDCEVLGFKDNKDSYEVKLNLEDAIIDAETANEFMEETML